jgi:hypothetical protein
MKRKYSDATRHNSACPGLISPLAMSLHRSQNQPASPHQHRSSPPVLDGPPAPSSALLPSHTPSVTTAPVAPRGTAPQTPSQIPSPYPRYPRQSQPQPQPTPSVPTPATTVSSPASPPSRVRTTSPSSSPAQPVHDAPTSAMSHRRAVPSLTPAPPVAPPLAGFGPTAAYQSATQPRPPRTRAQQWRTEPIVAALPPFRLSSKSDYPFPSVPTPLYSVGSHEPK